MNISQILKSTLMLFWAPLVLHAIPQAGLVAHYDFENGAANTVAAGSALPDGSLEGDATTVTTDPIEGSYLELDGNGDYVDIGDDAFFDTLASEWSAAAWFRANAAPSGNERFFIFETSGGFPISLGEGEPRPLLIDKFLFSPVGLGFAKVFCFSQNLLCKK